MPFGLIRSFPEHHTRKPSQDSSFPLSKQENLLLLSCESGLIGDGLGDHQSIAEFSSTYVIGHLILHVHIPYPVKSHCCTRGRCQLSSLGPKHPAHCSEPSPAAWDHIFTSSLSSLPTLSPAHLHTIATSGLSLPRGSSYSKLAQARFRELLSK